MGERDLARQALGDASSRATSSGRSTRATGRSATATRPRDRRALGRRLRRDQHRAAPPARVLRRRELVGLRASRPDSLALRQAACSCSRRTTRDCLLPRVAPLAAQATGTYFWFYSGSTDRFAPPERRLRAASSRATTSRTTTSGFTAGTTGRSGVTPHALRTSPLPTRLGRCARALARVVGVRARRSGRSSRRRAGCTRARPVVALPGPITRDALALDELSHHASVPLLLFLAVWAVAAVLLALLARWARPRAAHGRPAARVGVVALALRAERRLDPRRSPDPGACGVPRRGGRAGGCDSGGSGRNRGRARSAGRGSPRVTRSRTVARSARRLRRAARAARRTVPGASPSLVDGARRRTRARRDEGARRTAYARARSSPRGVSHAGTGAPGRSPSCLLAVLLALHLERRFDDGAIVTGIAVVALLARRGAFTSRGDPSVRPRVLLHAVAARCRRCRRTESSRSG